MSGRAFPRLLALLVIAAHSIALARLVRSARQRVRDTSLATSEARPPDERVVAIVPVLNEQSRLAACLEGLIDQPSLVSAIVVVDTGSSDRTAQLVAAYQMRDSRVRWLSAGSPPVGWNGKVWGLVQACQAFPANWYLIIDADVRPAPTLAERMLGLAVQHGVTCGSVALQQRPMPDIGSWLLHPAFLTTLVYRYGVPGRLFSEPDDALVNGKPCSCTIGPSKCSTTSVLSPIATPKTWQRRVDSCSSAIGSPSGMRWMTPTSRCIGRSSDLARVAALAPRERGAQPAAEPPGCGTPRRYARRLAATAPGEPSRAISAAGRRSRIRCPARDGVGNPTYLPAAADLVLAFTVG
jgi:hypothetical protein